VGVLSLPIAYWLLQIGISRSKCSMEACQPCGKRNRETNKEVSEMIEQVINRRNMHLAYQQVVRNKGSAGVDGMPVSELIPNRYQVAFLI
jgi:hypothetical protein